MATAITQGLLLWVIAWLLPGFRLHGVEATLVAGLVVTLVTGALWPFGYWFATRFHPLLFPLVSFAMMGVVFLVADRVVGLFFTEDSMTIRSFWAGILVAIGLAIGNTVLSLFFAVNDERAYNLFVTRALRRRYAGTPRSDVPGILFLEIDGLAEPVLRAAMAAGYAPTLKHWLERGSHVMRGWEPDLSSQTSASQAGILLGSNYGIPAFRWWDKQRGELMVSSKMATARTLEQALSNGQGLLAGGGGSRFNVFSGDADDSVGTFSTVGRADGIGQFEYLLYFTNPYSLFRTLCLVAGDFVRERWEARVQRARDVRPRVERHLKYALIRAASAAGMQEAARFMLIADMFRGLPVVYATFFSYDEVAHHSGIDRRDALKVLQRLDRLIGTLERVSRQAPRPYRLVVLSDHGQSMGATFKQRYGQSLSELVSGLVAPGTRVAAPATADEALGQINAALAEAIRRDTRTAQLARRAFQSRMQSGELTLGAEEETTPAVAGAVAEASDVIVLASGNLGLISFPRWDERLTYEQIVERFPELTPGLLAHPGIRFIVVHSQDEGGLVIGREGVHYLEHGYAAGNDPLAGLGPRAADHLRRTDGFPNAPDILLLGWVDDDTGEVAAFEELVGSHGGLGGPQTQPFILYPADLSLDPHAEIVGAAALHHVLKGWIGAPSPPDPFSRPHGRGGA